MSARYRERPVCAKKQREEESAKKNKFEKRVKAMFGWSIQYFKQEFDINVGYFGHFGTSDKAVFVVKRRSLYLAAKPLYSRPTNPSGGVPSAVVPCSDVFAGKSG
jgi:hypothetical protein